MNRPKLIGKTLFICCLVGAVILSVLLLKKHNSGFAANYKSLETLTGYKTKVYYSSGSKEWAGHLAFLCDGATDFYEKQLSFNPEITLLVLAPQDWSKFAGNVVYGMPHYSDKKLIVAARDNDFWRSFIPPTNKLPKELADQMNRTYQDSKGNISMQSFFDMLAIHELGHAYHFQNNINTQRNWLSELFANFFLYAYISENMPELLPQLTVFPEMVLATTKKENLHFMSLNDFENRYTEIARKYPANYGWYQCKLITAAADVYNSGGIKAFKNLWLALKENPEQLNDEQLVTLLHENVDDKLGKVISNWN